MAYNEKTLSREHRWHRRGNKLYFKSAETTALAHGASETATAKSG